MKNLKNTTDWLTIYSFIKNNTSINSSQIETLIILNAFSRFGKK